MKNNNPLKIFDEIHQINRYYFTFILETIQKNKSISQKVLDSITSLILYSPYEIYTKNLIAEFKKAVQYGMQFNITKLQQKHYIIQSLVNAEPTPDTHDKQ